MLIPQYELTENKTLRAQIVKRTFEAIESSFEHIEKKRELVSDLVHYAAVIEDAAGRYLNGGTYKIEFRGYTAYPGEFQITVKDLHNWRDIGTFIASLDFIAPLEDWSSEDDAESFSRVYTYGKPWNWQIIITATLKAETADCRRVITGWTDKQVVPPKPIYGFDCGDGPIPGPNTLAATTDEADIPF